MERTDCRVGQQVRVTTRNDPRLFGQVGMVKKVNSVNVVVELQGNRRLTAHPSFLEPVTYAEATVAAITTEPLPPPIGTIVRHTKGDPRIAGPHVVIGDAVLRGHTMVRIAKLGGDGGRFWRVSPKSVEVIEHFNLEVLD